MAVILALVIPAYVLAILAIALLAFYIFRYVLRTGPPTITQGDSRVSAESTDARAESESFTAMVKLDILPKRPQHTPLMLEWRDIELRAIVHGRPKQILHKMNGKALAGELVGIVGPSGSGKSTLLNILAMHLQQTSGEVLVDGRPRTSNFIRTASYVPQKIMCAVCGLKESDMLPALTAWETLRFYASLRLDTKLPTKEREKVIASTLDSMGLAKVRNTKVGGLLPGGLPLRGLSGGEVRRLHVGCGVLASPSILFLDEPTSGLDSHAAFVVMDHLRVVATQGCTIVCSIHQPRQKIWVMFQTVQLLADGFTIFSGDPNEAAPWFENNFAMVYDPNHCGSVSDWLLDLVSVHFGDSSNTLGFRSTEELQHAAELFLQSQPRVTETDKPQMETPAIPLPPNNPRSLGVNPYPTSFWNQLQVLSWRFLLQYLRNPADVGLRLFQAVFLGTLLGLVFLNTFSDEGLNSTTSLNALLSVLFYVLFLGMLLPYTMISLNVADRRMFSVDCCSNLYSSMAWFLAQTLMAVPFTLSSTWVMMLLIYGLVGLSMNASAVMITLAAVTLINLIGCQNLILAVHVMPNQDSAMVLAVTYTAFSLTLAGFFVWLSQLPKPLLWVSYVTPLRYAFDLLVCQQLQGTMYSPRDALGYTWATGYNFLGLALIYICHLLLTLLALYVLKRMKVRRH